MDLNNILNELSEKRMIFHSEADFQHAFAWMAQQHLPDAKIRLERPLNIDHAERIYLDILISSQGSIYGIELKHKTRKLSFSHEDESFMLKDQSAQDIGRYDFLKDLQRLEKLVETRKISKGYAIFLTNDHLYWTPRKKQTVDVDFNIYEGRQTRANEKLEWANHASAGTTKNRETPILLSNAYSFNWDDYSKLECSEPAACNFKILVVEVCNNNKNKPLAGS